MYARMVGRLIAFATFVAMCPAANATCSADAVASADAGRWTSGQLSTGQAAMLATMAGMRCTDAHLAMGADTHVVATIRSANGFELRRDGSDARIGYVASADHDGNHPITQDSSVDYATLGARSLPASESAREIGLPISFRSFHSVGLPSGIYSDVITIEWRWRTCENADQSTAVCKSHSEGVATTNLTVSMKIDAKPPIVTMAAKTIHASAGAATPEARRIVTVMVENPDVVPIDADSIVLEIPIDQRMTISDHPAGAFKAIEVVRGVEDGMGVSYGGLGDPTDDVECTSDGKDWTLQPVDPSQVRSVRIRVRGALQPSKSVVIALAGSMR